MGMWRELRAMDPYCLPGTTSIPERSKSSLEGGSLPTRSGRQTLSMLTISDTPVTESFARPV